MGREARAFGIGFLKCYGLLGVREYCFPRMIPLLDKCRE